MVLLNSCKRQFLLCPGTGMFCSLVLLIYQQHNCSFRARKSKKQQMLLAVGKHTPRKKRIYPYSNKRDNKQSHIHLPSFPSQKSLPVKLTLFKAPSRARFPIQTFRKPHLERGVQPVRDTESGSVFLCCNSLHSGGGRAVLGLYNFSLNSQCLTFRTPAFVFPR